MPRTRKKAERTPERLAYERAYREKNKAKLNEQYRLRKLADAEKYRKEHTEYKRRLKERKRQEVLTKGEKKCGTCKVVRPVAEFRTDLVSKDGYRINCRSCELQAEAKKGPGRISLHAKPKVGFKLKKNEAEGWRKVFVEADYHSYLVVWIRGLVMRFERGNSKSTQTVSSFAILGDDSGKRYMRLGDAERVAKAM